MKVIYTDTEQSFPSLTLNKVYEAEQCNKGWYQITDDLGFTSEYDDSLFEKIKEDKIKIKKWENLHRTVGDQFELRWLHPDVEIFFLGAFLNSLNTEVYSTSQMLELLKIHGFDIEFVENPKLTQEERYIVSAFVHTADKFVKNEEKHKYIGCEDKWFRINDDLFPFIKKGEDWTLKGLLELEVKNEKH